MKTIVTTAVIMLIVAIPMQGKAATVDVSFSPSSDTIFGLNQTFNLDIVGNYNADADELLSGGALDLSFDPSVLNVNSVALGVPMDFLSDPGTRDNVAGTVSTMGFATIVGIPNGLFTFATIEFMSVGFGTSPLQLSDSFDLVFAWANDTPPFGEPVLVNTTAGSVTVTDVLPGVPIPGAALLFGTGLIGLIAIARRKVFQ